MKENNKKFKTPFTAKKKEKKRKEKKSLEFLIKYFLCYIVTATQAPNQQNLVISPKFDTLTLTYVNPPVTVLVSLKLGPGFPSTYGLNCFCVHGFPK